MIRGDADGDEDNTGRKVRRTVEINGTKNMANRTGNQIISQNKKLETLWGSSFFLSFLRDYIIYDKKTRGLNYIA